MASMGAVPPMIGLIILALGAVLLGLLLVPMDFTISATTWGGVRVRFRWLFGLVRSGGDSRAQEEPNAVEALPPHRQRGPLRAARIARRLLAIEGLVSRFARLLLDLIRALRWRRGRVAVRAGLGDPAETGELCGLVGSILVLLPSRSELLVEFEPNFAEAVFDAEAEAAVRLVPAQVLGALGRFAVTRPGWSAIKVMVWDRRR
jgi:hypothetical protein